MEFLLDVFKIYFKEYNLFTTLCLFMLHSKIIQLYKYIYICIYTYTHTHILFIFFFIMVYHRILNIVTWAIGLLGGTSGKEPTCQWRRHKTCRFDPWVRKVPGGGHGNPLQYSCLENLMNRGVWQVAVHSIAKSWTRLKRQHTPEL